MKLQWFLNKQVTISRLLRYPIPIKTHYAFQRIFWKLGITNHHLVFITALGMWWTWRPCAHVTFWCSNVWSPCWKSSIGGKITWNELKRSYEGTSQLQEEMFIEHTFRGFGKNKYQSKSQHVCASNLYFPTYYICSKLQLLIYAGS